MLASRVLKGGKNSDWCTGNRQWNKTLQLFFFNSYNYQSINNRRRSKMLQLLSTSVTESLADYLEEVRLTFGQKEPLTIKNFHKKKEEIFKVIEMPKGMKMLKNQEATRKQRRGFFSRNMRQRQCQEDGGAWVCCYCEFPF